MPRTRRHCLEALATALLAPAAGLNMATAGKAPRPVLHCAWALQPGPQPAKLRFTLHNRGPEAVHLLVWGTPFEGWMSPWATVLHEGRPPRPRAQHEALALDCPVLRFTRPG